MLAGWRIATTVGRPLQRWANALVFQASLAIGSVPAECSFGQSADRARKKNAGLGTGLGMDLGTVPRNGPEQTVGRVLCLSLRWLQTPKTSACVGFAFEDC